MTKLGTTTGDADWRLVGAEGDPNAKGFRLIREVPVLDASVMDSLYETLLGTTTVTTPVASSEEGGAVDYTGTFVVSEVSSREDALRQGSIRQTLVKVVEYSAESTANLPAEADARLTRATAEPDSDIPGLQLVREWNFINPANSEDSLTVIRALETFLNPQAEGVTYSGLFWHSEAVLVREQDQTHTIRQTLTLLGTTTAEANAVLVRYEGTPDSDELGKVLVREWKWIAQTSVQTLADALNAIESYSGPEADGTAYTGTFANSDVQVIKQGDGTTSIRQTLTLTTADVAEGDAVLVSLEGDPQVGGYTMVREWRYLLDTAADTLFTTLNAVTAYTNPQADGQTYTGEFAAVTHNPQKQDDRTVTIRQTLIKVVNVTQYTTDPADPGDLDAITPRIERSTVNINEENDAHSWSASRDILTLTYEYLTAGSYAVVMDTGTITDANLETEASANADSQSWQLLDRGFSNNNNVGTFVCRFVDPDFVSYNASNLKTVSEVGPDGYTLTAGTNVGKQNVRLIRGLDSDNIVSDVAGVTAQSGYALDSVQGRVRDGEAEIEVRETKLLGGSDNPTEETIFPAFRRRREQRVYVWKNVPTASVATVYTTAQTIGSYSWLAGASGYTVVSARKVLHRNGSADIISRVEKNTNTSSLEVWEAFDKPISWIEKTSVNPNGSAANSSDGYWWRKWYELRRCGYKVNGSSAALQANQGLIGSFVKPAGDLYYYEKVTQRYTSDWKNTAIDSDTASETPFMPAYYKAPS